MNAIQKQSIDQYIREQVETADFPDIYGQDYTDTLMRTKSICT